VPTGFARFVKLAVAGLAGLACLAVGAPAAAMPVTGPAARAGAVPAGPVLGPGHCTDDGGLECVISAGHPGGGRPRGPSDGGHPSRPGAASDLGLLDLGLPDCASLAGAQECLHLPGLPEVPPHVRAADLAAMAMDRIALPVPRPYTSPAGRSWVGLVTFLWIDRRLWHPYRAGAAVSGQTVTLTARPTKVVWDLGEGSVECAGPGEPYRPGAPAGCGYTYRRSSAHAPGGSYELSATVYYTAEWTCAGSCDTASGSEGPLPATGRTRLRVGEIQTETTRA
jgi:hypothetical protein